MQAGSTVEGYLHAEMFSLIVPLPIGYFAIRAIAGPTVGAEESGHLDTILALPISRCPSHGRLSSRRPRHRVDHDPHGRDDVPRRTDRRDSHLPWTGHGRGAGVWPLALFAARVAALASGATHSSRTATGTGLGTLVAMYAVDLAGRLAPRLDPIRWASAFRYYCAPTRDGIDPAWFVGLVGVGILLLIAGAILLERRDVLH